MTWPQVEQPILEAIAEAEIEARRAGARRPGSEHIAETTGLPLGEVTAALERLHDSAYIDAIALRTGQGVTLFPEVWLLERGRRTAGMWPSDDPVQALVDALDSLILRTTDVDQRSRLEKLRDVAGDLSKATVSALLAQTIHTVAM